MVMSLQALLIFYKVRIIEYLTKIKLTGNDLLNYLSNLHTTWSTQ